MIIQKMTHISGFYGNESFCRCGAMRSIKPGPVPCLWLDVTEALHTEASIRLQCRGQDATGHSLMLVTAWLSCLTTGQHALCYD